MTSMKKPLATLQTFLAVNPQAGTRSAELTTAILAFVQGYHAIKFERCEVHAEEIAKIQIYDSVREIADWLEGELGVLARFCFVDTFGATVTRFVSAVAGQLVMTVTHRMPWTDAQNEPDPDCELSIEFVRIENEAKCKAAGRKAVGKLNQEMAAECVNRIPEHLPMSILAEALAKRFGNATAKAFATKLRPTKTRRPASRTA